MRHSDPGPLCTNRTVVLPQDLVKFRSREIQIQTFQITLKFDRHLGSSAAEISVKFQNDIIIITPNLVAWLWDFTWVGGKTSYRLVNRGPGREMREFLTTNRKHPSPWFTPPYWPHVCLSISNTSYVDDNKTRSSVTRRVSCLLF